MDFPKITIHEHEQKRHHSVEATRLIHEHYGTLMAHVYSREPLLRLRDRFLGEWKYLDRALFELSERRATRALIELALYIRLVDDDEGQIASKLRAGQTYGEIVRKDGTRVELSYRDVANKIIHAARYGWSIGANGDPIVTCWPTQDQSGRGYDWSSAAISLVALGAICGGLAS